MAMRYNSQSARIASNGELITDAMRDNPLIAAAAGMTAIVGGCVSMSNALILTILMFALLPLMGGLSTIGMERVRPRIRPAVYVGITAGIVLLLSLFFDNVFDGSVESLGIYAPLIAVDSLVLARAADDAPILLPREAVFEGIGNAAAFAFIALPVALLREIFGSGTIFGGWLGFNGFEALCRPFAGFILCGIVLGIYRAVTAKIFEDRPAPVLFSQIREEEQPVREVRRPSPEDRRAAQQHQNAGALGERYNPMRPSSYTDGDPANRRSQKTFGLPDRPDISDLFDDRISSLFDDDRPNSGRPSSGRPGGDSRGRRRPQ